MKSLAAAWRFCLAPEGVHLLPAGETWRTVFPRRAAWVGLSFVLVVVLVYQLAGAIYGPGQPARLEEFRNEPVPLDSFSEPALACAVLKQEADRLLLAYREDQERQGFPSRRARRGAGEVAAQPEALQIVSALPPASDRVGPQSQTIEPLLALDAQAQDVRLLLNRMLLLVYLDQKQWSPFVDRYLQSVREGPRRREAVIYGPLALDCAQKCGRVEEVMDLLQHFVRFPTEPGMAAELKQMLAKWRAERAGGP